MCTSKSTNQSSPWANSKIPTFHFFPRGGRFDFINWFILPRITGNRLLGGEKCVECYVLDKSLNRPKAELPLAMRMRHETIGTEVASTRKKLTPWNGWKRSTRIRSLALKSAIHHWLGSFGGVSRIMLSLDNRTAGFLFKRRAVLVQSPCGELHRSCSTAVSGALSKKNPRDLQLCCLKKKNETWAQLLVSQVWEKSAGAFSRTDRLPVEPSSASCRFVYPDPIVCDGSVSGRELLSGIAI